jgi:hypothetical protein
MLFKLLIGGEAHSSRGNIGQGGEREEVAIGGFQRTKIKGKRHKDIRSFPYGIYVHIRRS